MKKRMSALVLATAMAASAVTPAMAAAKEEIKSIDINITYSIEAGDEDWEFDIDCNTEGVEDVTWKFSNSNVPDEGEAWEDNVKPKVKISLDADSDYTFKFGDDDVNVTGTGIDEIYKVDASDGSGSGASVTITFKELEYPEDYWDTRLKLEDLDWDDETAIATWEENENAKYYEYKLYRGSSALTGLEKTEETELDLAKYFTRKGEYKLRVRAIYDSKRRGEWDEVEIDVDTEEAEEIYENAGSSSNSTSTSKPSNGPSANNTSVNLPSYVVKGNWGTKNGKWTFTDNKGVAYKNMWAAVYNPYANTAAGQQAFDWFYFDGNGEMVTGWILDGGRYYYCSPLSDGTQGRMVTGWFQIDGAWYYFNPNSDGTRGAMQVNKWIGNDYVGANGKFEKSR